MMVDFETQPGAPKQFVIDGVHKEAVETMMAVADRFEKTGTVRAIVAAQAGSIVTPEGTMRFGPGDMIVSDDPPTHAWPVRRDIFDRTYRQIADAVGRPLETTEAPAPTGDEVDEGLAALGGDDWEDVTGIKDEDLVEEVEVVSEEPIQPGEAVRVEDIPTTPLYPKRRGRVGKGQRR